MSVGLKRVFAAIFVVLGILMFLVPSHIAPVCPLPVSDMQKAMSNSIEGKMEAGINSKDCKTEECEPSMNDDKAVKDETMKKPMRCYHTGNAVKSVGVMMVLLGVLFFFIGNRDVLTGISISSIALGLLPVLFVHIIGVCMNPNMRCRTLTVPAVYLLSGLYIVMNVVFIIRNVKNGIVENS